VTTTAAAIKASPSVLFQTRAALCCSGFFI
jgi:hypothetical protein